MPNSKTSSDSRALESLGCCIEVVSRAESEAQLLGEMCGLLVERVGYRMAWIGCAQDDARRSVRVVTKAGFEDGYLENIDIRWSEEPQGLGPTGTAIRERRPVVVHDIHTEANYDPWREDAHKRGYCSCAALPLLSSGELLGVLNLYSSTPHAFEARDLRLLELLAANLAVGMHSLRRQEAEKLALRRLRAKTETLQAIYDASPDMIFLHDAKGTIIEVNESALEVYGLRREEIVGAFPEEFAGDPRATSKALGLVRRAIEGENLDFEWVAQGSDREFPVEVRLRRLPVHENSPGEPVVLALVRDLTDQKAAQNEQVKVEKLRSLELLAGGVAHDFNNLLTAMLGNLSLVAMDDLDETHRRLLREVEQAAERAAGLTQQLLLFSHDAPVLAPVRVEQVIGETLSFALRGSAVALDLDLDSGLQTANIDANQVSHALHNLGRNAVQAMPRGGRLRVEARNLRLGTSNLYQLPAGDYLLIAISDDGPGVPSEIAERIFDPYFTTKAHGTGLGLATSFNALRHGGGHLALRRQAAGCGAVFEVILPATSATPPPIPESVGVSRAATLAKVLVMDDEEQVLRYIARSLEVIGCDVTCVDNGDAALEVFQMHGQFMPFDVVILDMTIPGGHGGIWTLEQLLRLDPSVKAVAVSGYTIEATRAELLSHGFCEFIPKPMKPQALWRAVRAAVV